MGEDQAVAGAKAWARSADYPNGSTSRLRGDVLAALGVLKVATADQLQRITRPGLKSNKAIRAALLDLHLHALTASDGHTADREKLWRLTGHGLEAAQEVLPTGRDLGGIARGAGRSGAPHSMMVNETILAVLRGGTSPLGGPGVGEIADWSTETVHEVGPKMRAITDAVLRAPQFGLPVLLVEVDRGTMTPETVAAKFERYRRFFERTAKRGDEVRPYWHLMYNHRPQRVHGQDVNAVFPPVAIVFGGRLGPVALQNRLEAVQDASQPFWKPRWTRGSDYADEPYYWDYSGKIPVIATTLEHLRKFGLTGPVWQRYGHHGRLETLADALADPDGWEAYSERQHARQEAARKARKAKEDQEHEQDMQRRHCPTCGRRPDDPAYQDEWDASADGTTECTPCQDATLDRNSAQNAQERAQALRQAEARERCVTCKTGLLENSLLEHDPDAIECWKCHQNRSFEGKPPLRRPEAKKKRRLFSGS
ncbi:replication-relaxation family protein [Kitasatospora sp. NPDC051170]|uniref:replication-relaxation family protein n=1 Tax=Kitasatospora sp. NPDC051170 TaxID=3364056 RepID=UPI0037BA4517